MPFNIPQNEEIKRLAPLNCALVTLGSALSLTAAAAIGGIILVIPHYMLANSLHKVVDVYRKPYLYMGLQVALAITVAACSGLLGAAIFGLAINPVGLSLAAAAVVLNCVMIALIAFVSFICWACNRNSNSNPPVAHHHNRMSGADAYFVDGSNNIKPIYLNPTRNSMWNNFNEHASNQNMNSTAKTTESVPSL